MPLLVLCNRYAQYWVSTALHRTAFLCLAIQFIPLYCIALHCIAYYCAVFDCIALHFKYHTLCLDVLSSLFSSLHTHLRHNVLSAVITYVKYLIISSNISSYRRLDVRVLFALARGVPIVGPDWVEACTLSKVNKHYLIAINVWSSLITLLLLPLTQWKETS